jgi:hypothetical protein
VPLKEKRNMQQTIIYRLSDTVPAKLAAKELRRCLARLTGKPWTVRAARAYDPDAGGLWLGLSADLPLAKGGSRRSAAAADTVCIETAADGGLIAGSNPRSILLAAYRYLTELGCRWVRPGKTGEYLPAVKPPLPPVQVHERASYRHRGICIEGAVSWEHVRDTVAWLPKLGFNAYFIQFRAAYNFFQRWYEHEANPRYPAARFSAAQAEALTARVRAEVKQRGLDLHMVGHGWTCEPFGIPGPGWFQHQGPLPPEAVPHLAEIKGERKLWGNVALNTNLCYGNPETRRIVTDAIVEYAQDNPDVDIIHFWLADGSNNQCECPLCTPHRPSDLYVRMLNELDEKLTARGLRTRIVFLAYVDLLWPPVKERLRNPQRFILMFAPITRSYSSSFTAAGGGRAELPPYQRNQLEFPSAPAANLAFLSAWQEQFRGDGFDFDYHFMWDHHKDPGQFALARVLHQDLRGLRRIGLDGFMSCQNQRAFFPTGLGQTVIGRTLWDRTLSFKAIADDHLRASFGADSVFVGRYLRRLSQLFVPEVIRGEVDGATVVARWRRIPAVLDAARPHLAAGVALPDPCQAHSWKLLREHAEMCRRLSAALIAKHTGTPDEARQTALALVDWARRAEPRLHHVLDTFEFILTLGRYLGLSPADLGRGAQG